MRGTLVSKVWHSDPALYAPPRYRRACAYDAFIPDPLAGFEFDMPASVAAAISEAEKAIVDLNSGAVAELAPLGRLLLRTESIASSRVEGLQADTRTLARAEARQDAGKSVGPEAREVLANIDAMQLAVETAATSDDLMVADIAAIHQALLERAPDPSIAGRIRSMQNWIGGNDYNPCGADFVPPPPENVPPLIDDLTAFCNDDSFSPLAQAAIAHAQFETIHPFEDGNGRTGRALVQVILRRRDLAPSFVPPISVVLARSKRRYIDGLKDFRENRVSEWLELFATASYRAAKDAREYTTRVGEIQDGWRRALRVAFSPRTDSVVWVLVDVLPAHPIMSVPIGVAVTTRTRPAVIAAIEQLVAVGALKPLGDSAYNRHWEVPELLDLIADFDAGTP